MTRNLKALGLALVAVFAMSALSASAASAVDHFTTANGNPALLTGTGTNHIFHIPGKSEFKCTTSTFAGTALNGSTEATVDPKYTGIINQTPHGTQCTASLGNVTIDTNECHYVLTGNTTKEDPPPSGLDAVIWVQCPAGKAIQITGPLGCTVSVPTQTPTTGGVTYTTIAGHPGGTAVEVHATVTGITYTSTAACGFAGIPSHGNDATYNGTVTVTGFADNIDGLPTPITEGAQVGVSVS